MKRRVLAAVMASVLMVSAAAGCGKESNSEMTYTNSGQYELNCDELVTKLADYEGIDVALSMDYTVTDELVKEQLEEFLAQTDAYEKANHDTIKEGDYVLVDYTGYLDGEAFENGAATQQYLYCASDNGYIPGFTDGLLGHSAGETITCDVTFPDPYNLNPNLSGKTTQFEYVIYGIYSKKTLSWDTITDEDVVTNFESQFGVKTVDELFDYVKTYISQSYESKRYSEIVDGVKSYMTENSEVTIPEAYLTLRVDEYITQFTDRYVTDGTDLETFLASTYNMTLEQAREEWTNYITDTIKIELIFEAIANKEGVEMTDEEFAEYVASMTSNYGFESNEATYKNFGGGDASYGEAYMKRLYRINSAIDIVVEKANTHVEEATDATDATDSTEASTEE